MLYEKGVLTNFAKLAEKQLCQSLFFNEVRRTKVSNFIKKDTLAHVFSVNFTKFLRKPFATEHRWATASKPY